MNLYAGQGVAVREFIMAPGHGRADYLLFVEGEAAGAVEAKPSGTPLTGSSRSPPSTQPGSPGTSPRWQALIEKRVLVLDGLNLRLTEDYVFPSPSTAATVLLGRTSNGRVEWKSIDGKTLKELQTADAPGLPGQSL